MAARSYKNQGRWTKKAKTWDTVSSDLFDAVVSARSKFSPGGWNRGTRSPQTGPIKRQGDSAGVEKARIAYEYSHSPGSKVSADSTTRSDSPRPLDSASRPGNSVRARGKISQKRKLTESLKVFDFASDDEDEGMELEEGEGKGGSGRRSEAKSTNGRRIKKARAVPQSRGPQRKSQSPADADTSGRVSPLSRATLTSDETGRKRKKVGPLKKSAESFSTSAKKTYPTRASQTQGSRVGISRQSGASGRRNSSRASESRPGDIDELPSKRAKVSPSAGDGADSEDVWGSQNLEPIEEGEDDNEQGSPPPSEMDTEEEKEGEGEEEEEEEEVTEKLPYVNMYPGRKRVTRGFVRMLSSQESDLESPSQTTDDLGSRSPLKSQEAAPKVPLREKVAQDLSARQPRAKARGRAGSGARGNSPAGGWSDSETEGSQEMVEKQAARVVVRPTGGSRRGRNPDRSVAATPTDSVTPLPTSSAETDWLRSSPETDSQEVAERSEDPLEGVRTSGSDSSRSRGSTHSGRGQTQGSESGTESGLGTIALDDGMETGSTDFDASGNNNKQFVSEGSSTESRVSFQSDAGSQKSASSASESSSRKPSSKFDSKKLTPVIEIMDEAESEAPPVSSVLEETPNLSLSEPADKPAFSRHFERHLHAAVPSMKKSVSGASGGTSKAPPPPSLVRSFTWPKSYSASGAPGLGQGHGVKCPRGEKELVMVVRNVKQAHECLELGENQQFFDEMQYLLESLRPHQSTSLRGLGMCNLAQQCLNTSFSQQIRAHGFTPKITALLGDCLEDPTLRIAAAVLLYVITRDRLNSDWSREEVELLVNMLAEEGVQSGAGFGSLETELSSKARREFTRVKSKASAVLRKVREFILSRDSRPSGEGAGDGGEEEEGGGARENSEREFCVDPENVSVPELARECLLSLTSPHHLSHPHPSHQHTPHQLREELRILGGLDHFANAVISICTSLESVEPRELGEGEGEGTGGRERVEKQLRTLGRLFKCLENVTYMNQANQSYLVVFDGSLLVSNLTRLIPLCQKLLEVETLRSPVVETLLGVMKVLLNLTHDNELGSHRVGEQQGGVYAVLGAIFHLPPSLPLESQFDITVLALGLLINLVEHSAKNRTQLETLHFSSSASDPTTSSREDDVMGFRSNYSSIRALLQLFLKHHSKAEEATIEVPTPQRLSQLGGSSPHQSPMKPGQLQRELTPSFAARMRLQQGGRASSKSKKKGRGHRRDGMDWLRDSQDSSSSQHSTADTEPRESESESEEEFESVPTDPLVFSREEFETALNQAGQHMEDSIVASYTALLLGIMIKHNQDTVDLVRQATPSKTFAEMIGVLRKFVSFMNITGSSSGLESIRHIVKYLEALDT